MLLKESLEREEKKYFYQNFPVKVKFSLKIALSEINELTPPDTLESSSFRQKNPLIP